MEVGGQGFELFQEGICSLVGGGGFADGVIEAALAFDVGILERVGPRVELFGAGLGEGDQGRDLRLEMGRRGEAEGEAELGAGFAGGATGDVEEHEAIGSGATFEAFGDVAGDGKGGAAELVGEVAGLTKGFVVGELVDANA